MIQTIAKLFLCPKPLAVPYPKISGAISSILNVDQENGVSKDHLVEVLKVMPGGEFEWPVMVMAIMIIDPSTPNMWLFLVNTKHK